MGAMDDPFVGHVLGDVEPFFVQGLDKACTKDLCQGKFIEEVFGLFLFPLFSGLVHPTARHDHMDVGVVVQTPGMGVEDGGHADLGAEVFGFEAKVFEGGGYTIKHQVVDKGLMVPGQEPEFIREGEGYQEILDREELFVLPIQPDRDLMILALGATAMATGSGSPFGVVAIGTMHEEFPGLWCAALSDGLDGALVAW